ncbi:LIV-II [Serratia proteamaculans]|uniref:branched-chain amino acid transport system II carrier protein n=1 Tax=Serratia proteamaculans TaxID=28151 RepID=UPI000EDE54DC|nr:branched-chain amino acid transport system II carrier protein [Serratia proteamaculans]CAI1560174.1 LIV-II [Serratia proteamaculans]HCV64905.1 branched-chain amino acid transport system II carrier protein [Serratia sp. (in: enterobacteria)]
MKTFRIRDIFILGLMNFALFVGAGNIIFPPFIGLQAGTSVWAAAAGFLLTGVGLPVVTAMAMAKAGGSLAHITQPVGRHCGMLLTIICYLCIGPLFATPRTASVSYELAIQPFTESERWLPLWSIAYFAIVILVSLYPGRLLDTVGKVLSPVKIIALLILAITAIILPAGKPQQPVSAYATAAFSEGLTNGYLTMDTLAALVFGLVIVGAIQSRGVTSVRLVTRYAVLSGLIAGAGLALVYLSLFRLGTGSTGLIENATNGAQVLGAYVHFSYGTAGNIFLGVLITIACMVTAIGLTCACAGYFSSITRISYRTYAWFFAAFAMLVSNLGLTHLITVSVPILTAVYPVFVVLILTYFIRGWFQSAPRVVRPAALIAFLFGLADALEASGITLKPFILARQLPLHDQGLAWILPVLSIMVLAAGLDRVKGPVQTTACQERRSCEKPGMP